MDLQVRQEDERLGFALRSLNRNLRDARVRLNHVEYDWEFADGSHNRRKDIFVGDDPSMFFPFKHSFEWIEPKDLEAVLHRTAAQIIAPKGEPVRGGVLLKLADVSTGKEFWSHLFIIGEGELVILSPGNVLPGEFAISIQIIAAEIEEEMHFDVGLGTPLQVFDLDKEKPIIRYDFSVRRRKSFFSPKIRSP